MVSLARGATGLLYQSDGTLSGWTSAGNWTAAAEPGYSCFAPLPLSLLAPGSDAERTGVREFGIYTEDPTNANGPYYYTYDAGDGAAYWRSFMAISTDRGLTVQRLGPMSDGISQVSSGTYPGVAMGVLQKRGSTYVRHRVFSLNPTYFATHPSDPNIGIPAGPYGWDIWTAPSVLGPWTGVRTVTMQTGSWCEQQKALGSVVYSAGTFYGFASGAVSGNPQVGVCTSSTATGDYLCLDTANPGVPYQPSGLNGFAFENPEVFYSQTFSTWCMVGNCFDPAGAGFPLRNAIGFSATVSDWTTAAKWSHIQKVSPLDAVNAIGVMRLIHGPEDTYYYEPTSGIIPVTFDCDAPLYSSFFYAIGRRIKAAALEPSAHALRYAGSTDTTSRSISRALTCADFVLEFTCKPTAFNGSGGSLMVDLLDGSTNGYRFTFTGASHGSISKLTAGSPSTLAAGSGSETFDATGMQHRCKIALHAGVLSLWLNGELQATASDSSTLSFVSAAVAGKGLDCDIRCLSARASDSLTITGLTPGTSCNVRGYGALPAGAALADGSGAATFSHVHYPLWGLEIGGVDYTPAGGLWGGDTLAFTGLPTMSAVAFPALAT